LTRASIAIFPQKTDYMDNRAKPETPNEVFEAAQRIIDKSSGCEIVRTKTGLYVVAYSKSGPSKHIEGWENWLPVYVAKIHTWASGGIKTEELKDYKDQKKDVHTT